MLVCDFGVVIVFFVNSILFLAMGTCFCLLLNTSFLPVFNTFLPFLRVLAACLILPKSRFVVFDFESDETYYYYLLEATGVPRPESPALPCPLSATFTFGRSVKSSSDTSTFDFLYEAAYCLSSILTKCTSF